MHKTTYNQEWEFSKSDTLDELDNKLSIISMKKSYTEQDISSIVNGLVNLGVNTYNFSYCANGISPNLTIESINMLNEDLSTIKQKSPNMITHQERKRYFCEFYLLTYRHFRDEQIEEMKSLIENYGFFFTNSQHEKETALIYQVKGRYYRSIGDIDSAITNDNKAIDLLKKQKINNVQVQITYAGTLLRALLDTGDEKYVAQVKNAIEMVERAISEYPNIPRYYYLLAKLNLYILLYDSDISTDEYNKKIQKSRALINTAIDKENPQSNAYFTNVSKYNTVRHVAEFVLLQRKFIDQTKRSLEGEMNSSKVEIDDTLRRTQNRYLEVLGLFVSIIAIIMAFIQSFSGNYSVFEMVTVIIAMNAGLLAVYATFLILLRDKFECKYAGTIVICIVIIIVILVFGKTYFSDHRTIPENQTFFDSNQSDITSNQNIDSSVISSSN